MFDISCVTPQIISGFITASLGWLAGYFSAIRISNLNSRKNAVAKLRASFAPALAQIYLVQNHGSTHDRPSIEDFVKNNLLAHASAIEEFRPFVSESDSSAYQEAWESYRKLANDPIESAVEDRFAGSLTQGSSLEQHINHILSF